MAGAALAAVLLVAGAVGAGAAEAPTPLEPVVVTATRSEQRASEAPAAVTVLTRKDLGLSASETIDDLLREVPGFSLFRRTSSLVGHPTTQGVSLRGIGPSGTSRALVLLDGIPLNDPFGGWVQWNRVPFLGVERIEVVRGGGSSVWGNFALGGVVHILSRRPTERQAEAEASYGSHDTSNVDLRLAEAQGRLRLGFEGNFFHTDGFPVVKASRRGRIDVDADSEHGNVAGRVEWVASPDLELYTTASYFDEVRGNGTPIQKNDTQSALFAGGGRVRTPDGSRLALDVFGETQHFRSTFSSQALDRNSETLALDQHVPATSVGGALQWSRGFGRHLLSAGLDTRWIDGETDEDVFGPSGFLRRRVAGGEQTVTGFWGQDVYAPAASWEIVGGVRVDYWRTYDASRRDTPPPAGVPAHQDFADQDAVAVSPRLAVLYAVTPTTDLRASAYRGFRAPTLNELYRVFRVRNDVTAANAGLRPEQLTGGELGVEQRWGPVRAGLTGFWNDVTDLVTNVTLTSPLPDCPAGTTCRQRQNLELGRIRGLEAEVEVRPAPAWRFSLSYLFTDARVVEARRQRDLEGRRLAQVPEHTWTVGARWDDPRWLSVSVTGRFVGDQFEDDQNTLPLGSFFVVDVFLARALWKGAEAFLAVENLLDETYATGRSTDGVVSIGTPRLIRGGLRLRL